MEPAASYAVVASVRTREMGMRLGIAGFIACAAYFLSPSVWPILWMGAVVGCQMADRIVSSLMEGRSDASLPKRHKAAYVASTFINTTVYASIAVYFWFPGGDAGSWFALLLCAGGMLHVSLKSWPSKWVLIAGALPHAAFLFTLPVATMLTREDVSPAPTAAVIVGAIIYITQLVAGVRQSQGQMNRLRAATIEANEAREFAERASAAKSEFLATVSHEIRTPMNAVLSAAHLLKRTSMTPEQEGHVAMLTNGGEVLVGLLNDVLDISKIEAGKMVLEDSDLNLGEALDSLVQLYQSRAEANGVSLVLDAADDLPAHVRTDPLRLRQILFNLLSNAVKFTEKGAVTIRAGRHNAGTAEWLWFEVQDSGCGIDPEAMKRLFGSFEQAKAATARNHGGTGLGLAISRKLAEMMGGSLDCESVVGKGSTFRLELPLVECAGGGVIDASDALDEAMQDDRELSILVAEDHDVNRRIVSLFLEPLGWRLTMAKDGGEAVNAAACEVFDIILMDMQMPVMNGVDAALTIRGNGGPNMDTPIIALTANALGHHREAWDVVGVAAFLTKPINPELLVSTIMAATARRDERVVAAANAA